MSYSLSQLETPSKKISTEEDVSLWKTTTGYKTFIAFLKSLNQAVVGYELPDLQSVLSPTQSSSSPDNLALHPGVKKVLELLGALDQWIDEIPPFDMPQRFGNLAFRVWGDKLDENSASLIASLYEKDVAECGDQIRQLQPYLNTSFGSFTRMDYGTGHEASFAMFLLSLSLLSLFSTSSDPLSLASSTLLPLSQQDMTPDICRQLVLIIFPAYLKLCYKLQDTYRLEPAGSHGVWGLDDSSFLPYLWGSGMLRDQSENPPSSVLKQGLPKTNLYYVAVERVRKVKKGPFHEHSSQLYSIATGVTRWKKVNDGMIKMYEAEVLGKRVVVQHLPLGGLITWDPLNSSASTQSSQVHPSRQADSLRPIQFPSSTQGFCAGS